MPLQSLGQEDPLEKGMATHSSILAWRIPWTEQPGGLQCIASHSPTQLKQLGSHTCRLSMGASLVKTLPAMQETPVRFLSQEDLLEKE